MAKNNRIHVTGTRGDWRVVREGNERASATAATKDAAIERARELAMPQGGQVIIHGTNGRIQSERSYGNDPFPPKG